MEKIGIASDHAGYDMKIMIINYLESLDYEVVDFGAPNSCSCDYADFAHPLAYAIESQSIERGIAICGSANGITITLNKHHGIRAAICWLPELAALAREHNNANICSLAARFIDDKTAIEIVTTFLKTPFSEDERHKRRIEKIIPCINI